MDHFFFEMGSAKLITLDIGELGQTPAVFYKILISIFLQEEKS